MGGWKKRKEHNAQSVLGFAYGLAVVTVPKQLTLPNLLSGFFALSLFAESLNSQVVTSLFTELTNFQLFQLHSRAYQCFQIAVTENRCGFKTPLSYF